MHPQDRLFCEIAVQLNLLTREQVTRCMQMQQREAGGKTIAVLATSLGLMDQAAVDRVMHQQQRVLERRREARESSRKQREAESRAAAGLPASAEPRESSRSPAPSLAPGPRVPRAREPTPTAPWVQSSATSGNRLKADEHLPKGAELLLPSQLESNEIRETLDVRPPQRSAGRGRQDARSAHASQVTAPLPPGAAPVPDDYDLQFSSALDQLEAEPLVPSVPTVEARPGRKLRGEPSVEGEDAELEDALAGIEGALEEDRLSGAPLSAARGSFAPADQRTSGAPAAGVWRSEARASGAPLSAAARRTGAAVDAARSSGAPERRSGASLHPNDRAGAMAPTAPLDTEAEQPRAPVHRTQLGAGPVFQPEREPERESEQREPEQRESEQREPTPVASAPPRAARGTLLETSGREQQRRQQEPTPGFPKPSSRPVPTGRDWRNPSRPPPPSVGFDIEISLPPSTPLPMPAVTPAGGRAIKAPPLDSARYVDRTLELCAEMGASDAFVSAGAVPCLRIDGRLWPLAGEQPLRPSAAERAIAEVLDDAQLMQLSLDGELRCSYQLPGGNLRARLHAFAGEHGLNVALRLLAADAPAAERIGLGPALRVLRESPWGLCICSGPAGSGRTTSLWSLTKALASERALHVISLESPLELQFQSGLGLCEQREVGQHVASYAEGIDWALNEAADVIVVSDLLAPGAFAASLRACRARCLVLAGVRAASSLGALSRLLSEPAQDAELLRFELSHALRLLLHQRLVPRAKVAGRVAAVEQVLNTPQVAQLIRDDKLQQLQTVLASSKALGMVSLDDALEQLVRASTISQESARAAARRGERWSARGG